VSEVSGREPVAAFEALGVTAFTTTRLSGDFGIGPDGPDARASAKWTELLASIPGVRRLASARQVHGRVVVAHSGDWEGWRRLDGADGHVTATPGTALAVTVADCVPVFLAHSDGIIGVLHAGWRGVAGRILDAGLDAFASLGAAEGDVHVHLGPAISGRAYEVGVEVYEQLTGWETKRPRHVDLRALLAEQARARGVRALSVSPSCTREDNAMFFSHRAGDAERQVAVIALPG
jgi:YfiH family protein